MLIKNKIKISFIKKIIINKYFSKKYFFKKKHTNLLQKYNC